MPSETAATHHPASSRRSLSGVNLGVVIQSSWLPPALLALATFALYGRVLGFAFVSDDAYQVLQNPYVRNPHLWTRIFTTSVWSFEGRAVQSNFYRPLQIFCYWVLYRLAGPQPLAFHILNLALYLAGALLVFYIGVRLFRRRLLAFLATLLWIAHPLHVEAAAWIAALPDLGFGFFCLLAFLIFLRTEQNPAPATRGYALAALAFFPALFFKEAALSFPLVLLAFWFFRPIGIEPRRWKDRLLALGFCGTALAAAAAIRIVALGHLLGGRKAGDITFKVLASALGLLGENAKIFFYPAHLSIFRTFAPAGALHAPWTWIAISLLAAAIIFRHRVPLAGFLVTWWFAGLIPCLDVRQLSVPYVADRFSYIPSVGLCLAIAWLAFGRNEAPINSVRVRFGIGAVAALAVVWSVQTLRALPAWQSDGSLIASSQSVYPGNAALHLVQGRRLAYRFGDISGADRQFREAITLNRTSFRPLASITYSALIGLGEDSERSGHLPAAIGYFQQAIHLLPNRSEAYQVMGAVYFPRRSYSRAASYFVEAVKLDPMNSGLHFYLGTCWLKLGRYHQAAEQLHTAREIDPTLSAAYIEERQALKSGVGPQAAVQVGRQVPQP